MTPVVLEEKRSILFVTYGTAWPDPPQRQSLLLFAQSFARVVLFEGKADDKAGWSQSGNIELYKRPVMKRTGNEKTRLGRLMRFISFRSQLKQCLREVQPDVVVTYMFHALAALPNPTMQGKNWNLVSMILDIPSLKDSGMFDHIVTRIGWRRLSKADVVWASDAYKAKLVNEYGKLTTRPLVCHNCPPLDYLAEPTWPRDPWLRIELRKQGATIVAQGGCILLRAGAVGECGGIEETLEAMRDLPDDYVFLMMGRPEKKYREHVEGLIAALGLQRRVFLWERSNDQVWKRALLGADVGHLIHGPFPPGRMTRLYELNSSLSNNRLYQYMAAGLPIIAYNDPRMDDLYAEVDCFCVARLENLGADLRQTIETLGSNPDLRRELGGHGRQAHLKTYNWDHQFEPILQRLHQLEGTGR
jgi:glycosyltransferase involved in cell wall biosynthesis